MKVLSADAMRALDRRAIDEVGIPGLVLMENAAIGVADVIDEIDPEAVAVSVLCGPGNNGGDGLAVARHLAARGYDVVAIVIDGGGARSPDLETQLEICRRLRLNVVEPAPDRAVELALELARGADLLVDALFGIGLSRPLSGVFAELVTALAELPQPVVAVDVPSGLNGSRPSIDGVFLPADTTVTFAAPKIAHALAPASDAIGELVVVDLGFGADLVAEAEGSLELLLGAELAPLVRARRADGHKGTFGHLLVVAGARGTSGAAVLAARAAGRSGVGLVTVATSAGAFDLVESGSTESMTIDFPEALSAEWLRVAFTGKTALAVGPGAGVGEATGERLRELAIAAPTPAVLDAEALSAFAGRAGEIRDRGAATVLTPHPGEIARLAAIAVPRTSEERLEAARRVADASGAVVVLKGRQTLVCEPGAKTFVNTTGNTGMATGGSGDVLTGLLGGLLAQGYEASLAARLAVYLHGSAGDLVVDSGAEEALLAGDLVDSLPAAWRELRS